jgi:hypothetical protein
MERSASEMERSWDNGNAWTIVLVLQHVPYLSSVRYRIIIINVVSQIDRLVSLELMVQHMQFTGYSVIELETEGGKEIQGL